MAFKFGTKCVHAGKQQDPHNGSIVAPIQQSVTFRQAGINQPIGFEYARAGNPSREILERAISELEGYKHSICFGSGIASELALFQTLSAGDHVIFCEDTYGGVYTVLNPKLIKFGLEKEFIKIG